MTDVFTRLAAALSDRYRIEHELGEGGMATVYLAEDLKHHRQVAIKLLKPELAAVLGAERFVQEIATTAQLQHQNILPLFDSGNAGGFLFYVMPYVEGETLRARLDRETQMGVEESVKLVSEVADALQYAHEHGVVHRDIKPENILIHAGRPMVADFGIALAVSAAAGGRMTETGLSLGTPHYMSPEQATADKNITARSDVYSLASVLYEMLTGDPPHTGKTARQIIAKIIADDARPVGEVRRSVPSNVAAALSKALEKLPADRFGSAEAFAEALENPAFTTTAAAGATKVMNVRALKWWIRSPWSWGMTALAAAALVFGGVAEHDAHNVPALTFTQRSYEVQAIFNARFAPDGRTMVFSASGATGTTPRLYVIRPDNPDPTPLGPDSTQLLSISSTGQLAVLTHAAYLVHRLFAGTLSTLALGGESPREVATHVRGADWAPDGQSLAVIRDTSGVDLLEYPMGTVLAQTSGCFSDLRVSPTGDAVAYFEHPTLSDDRGRVLITDLNGHSIARSRSYAELEGLAWSPDGSGVLFSGVEAGGHNQSIIWKLTRSGHERRVLAGAGGLTVQDVAHDGRLLVTQDQLPGLVFVRGPGASDESNMGVRDYSSVPILSDDGRYVAFADEGAMGGPDYTVMLRKTDGSPETPLGPGAPVGFSADGRFVLARVASTPPRLMLYPTGVGQSRELDIGRFEGMAARSPDVVFDHDTRFFFCGTKPKALPRCYVGAVSGGPLTPVTPEGTGTGVISPDGTEVAAGVGDSLRIFPVAGGTPEPVRGTMPGDQVIRWSPDGRELWVYGPPDSTFTIRVFRVNPRTGVRAELTTIVPQHRHGMRVITRVTLADDPQVYGYMQYNYTSLLYTVDGVR